MTWLNVILMGIGLAMDCCAVSAVQGLTADIHDPQNRPKPALMALIFGCFHLGMPIIGYYLGSDLNSDQEAWAAAAKVEADRQDALDKILTGIDDVRSKMSEVRSGYYTLNGQKVVTPRRGLYIHNGRKVVVK